ncbi:unnamed protein product [Cuscuta campestris]|uniref:Uncharacterized protein n=1 Tax=Cuscuta campestris TaxID=132261 RepID=A0A484N6V5_9ASTE|nr:unnamed protein product [Cuscuta campestris]
MIKDSELALMRDLLGDPFRVHHPDTMDGVNLTCNPEPGSFLVMHYDSTLYGFRFPLHSFIREVWPPPSLCPYYVVDHDLLIWGQGRHHLLELLRRDLDLLDEEFSFRHTNREVTTSGGASLPFMRIAGGLVGVYACLHHDYVEGFLLSKTLEF